MFSQIKSKRFRDYCKEIGNESFLSIKTTVVYFRYVIDKNDIYMCVSWFWSILWSKTQVHSWAGSSLQLIRSVYSSLISFQALSKQLTGTEFISRFSVQSSLSQLSFGFLQPELSQFWALTTEHFFRFFLMDDNFYIVVLNILPLYCYLFKTRFRSWINGCAWNKKIQVWGLNLRRSSYLSCTDIITSLWGWKASEWIARHWVLCCSSGSSGLVHPSKPLWVYYLASWTGRHACTCF